LTSRRLFALDHAGARVTLRTDTSDGFGLLLLQVLVGSLLPFLGHGLGRGTSSETDSVEGGERDTDTDQGVEEDLGALTGRGSGTGTVRAESDVVGCSTHVSRRALATHPCFRDDSDDGWSGGVGW
jgi:hypothetical protein